MKLLQPTLAGLILLTSQPLQAQLNAAPGKGEDTYHFIARQMWGCAGVYGAMKETAPTTTSAEDIKAFDDSALKTAEYGTTFSKGGSLPSDDQKRYFEEGFDAAIKARGDPQRTTQMKELCVRQVKFVEETAAKAQAKK